MTPGTGQCRDWQAQIGGLYSLMSTPIASKAPFLHTVYAMKGNQKQAVQSWHKSQLYQLADTAQQNTPISRTLATL